MSVCPRNSIGFETIQDSVEDGIRLLKEIRLWEVSIVTFPHEFGRHHRFSEGSQQR
jgi:phage head maturation protease